MNTGSMMNHLMDSPSDVTPAVGMGVTELCWTDRRAYTIIEVVNAKTLRVQKDKATRTDGNGMSDCQSYSYEPDPEGSIATITLRSTKRGPRWVAKGYSVKDGNSWKLGIRDEYHDYSF